MRKVMTLDPIIVCLSENGHAANHQINPVWALVLPDDNETSRSWGQRRIWSFFRHEEDDTVEN
jgi:hypothetical protein